VSHVRRAVPATTRIGLSLELNPVAFVQFIEDRSLDARRVKEQFLAARVTNEAETSIIQEPRDRAGFGHVCTIPFCFTPGYPEAL
jgi:hypothetical protein